MMSLIKSPSTMSKYEKVFFYQLEFASTIIKKIEMDGPEVVLEDLKERHHPGEHMVVGPKPWGSRDNTLEKDSYVLNWNKNLGYVGLYYKLES